MHITLRNPQTHEVVVIEAETEHEALDLLPGFIIVTAS